MNTSNCESVKVQLHYSVGSSTMDDVIPYSLKITGDEGQNITSNNVDRVPGAAPVSYTHLDVYKRQVHRCYVILPRRMICKRLEQPCARRLPIITYALSDVVLFISST